MSHKRFGMSERRYNRMVENDRKRNEINHRMMVIRMQIDSEKNVIRQAENAFRNSRPLEPIRRFNDMSVAERTDFINRQSSLASRLEREYDNKVEAAQAKIRQLNRELEDLERQERAIYYEERNHLIEYDN